MKALAAGLALLCLAGCGLQPPAADRQSFLITAKRPVVNVRVPVAGSLVMGRIEVVPPFDNLNFVYKRGEALFETDFYNQYAADPALLLGEAAAAWLRDSGIFSTVLGPHRGSFADYRLEAAVEAMYVDFTAEPAAVIAVRWRLWHEADARMVLEHARKVRSPLPERSPRGSAAAFNAGFADILNGLEAALAASAI